MLHFASKNGQSLYLEKVLIEISTRNFCQNLLKIQNLFFFWSKMKHLRVIGLNLAQKVRFGLKLFHLKVQNKIAQTLRSFYNFREFPERSFPKCFLSDRLLETIFVNLDRFAIPIFFWKIAGESAIFSSDCSITRR